MKRMFEPVNFDGAKLRWDYRSHIVSDYKGYYHWHQCCEVIFVHDGQGNVVVGGETFPIQRGMLFFFQPFQLHHVHANVGPSHPYKRTIFYFDPIAVEEWLRPFARRHSLFTDLWRGHSQAQAYDLRSREDAVERHYDDYEAARMEGRGEDSEEIAMLILGIVDGIYRSGQESRERTQSGVDLRPVRYAQEAMRWIDDHYREEFSLDRLARELHLSKFYLSKVFSEETGSTLREYVTARRMKKACRLLETTTMSVEQIGMEVGIRNASYFVQLFKKVVGTTPLQYRMAV